MAGWIDKMGSTFFKPFIREYSVDGLTALAGGGQSGATALAGGINRFTTVATRGDSAILPSTVPVAGGAAYCIGGEIVVINAGAQPMAVFPATGEAINGQAANASVTVLPNEVAIFVCPVKGQWYAEVGLGVSGSIPTDIYQDNITATGTSQSNGTVLAAELNRVTGGAATTGVVLPVSAAGMGVFIVNHAGNSIHVYGNGSDQIDDIAGATGVVQMNNSVVFYFCVTAGSWYTEGLASGFSTSLGLATQSSVDNLTALAGGGQSGATPLTAMLNRVTTVASANDSVLLPASTAGLSMTVINAAATNSMNVFPAVGDKINALATNAAFAVAAGKTATFYCVTAGQWHTILSA